MQPVAKTSEPRLSPLSTSGELNAILAPTGWSLMDVTVNTETGFARVVAERRDHSAGTGIKVGAIGCPRHLCGPVEGPESGRFEVLELSPEEDFEITEVD